MAWSEAQIFPKLVAHMSLKKRRQVLRYALPSKSLSAFGRISCPAFRMARYLCGRNAAEWLIQMNNIRLLERLTDQKTYTRIMNMNNTVLSIKLEAAESDGANDGTC